VIDGIPSRLESRSTSHVARTHPTPAPAWTHQSQT